MNSILPGAIQQVMPTAFNTGLFVSLATFYQPSQTQGPTGNLIGTFTPVSGYEGIYCMDAPLGLDAIQADEAKSLSEILAKGYRHILLNGYWPNLFFSAESGYRVTIQDPGEQPVFYDLLSTESNSQNQITRVRLQRVVE